MIVQDGAMSAPRFLVVVASCALVACSSALDRHDHSWRLGTSGVGHSLRGLAPVSASVCYVGGANGTLRKTADGGRTWLDIAPRGCGDCDFRDVEVLAGNVVLALVAGAPARLYRSQDGGATWRLVHEDPRSGAFFDAFAFDGLRGVVFGDAINGRFVLLQTQDGGATWQDMPAPALPRPGPGEAAFAASGSCLSAGPSGFSLVTGGGPCRHIAFTPGQRAASVSLPMQRGASSRGAFSVCWSGDHGVCVGGDYKVPGASSGSAAVSRDGGKTWAASNAGGYRSSAAWLGPDQVLAVGSSGASWSEDGGDTFALFGSEGFHSVAQAADGAVWACGADGRVAQLVSAGSK